eukprot:m.59753 g.59753  ORF g.59753 m.59753 type:complete len:181 (+) comp15719_c1_seq1:78-620(+)
MEPSGCTEQFLTGTHHSPVKELPSVLEQPSPAVLFVGNVPTLCRYFMDASKLEALGWTPTVCWKDGLRATIEWYRANADHWPHIDVALMPHPPLGKRVTGELPAPVVVHPKAKDDGGNGSLRAGQMPPCDPYTAKVTASAEQNTTHDDDAQLPRLLLKFSVVSALIGATSAVLVARMLRS